MRRFCKTWLLGLWLGAASLHAAGQARMVFDNDAYLVIDNAAQLVIDNPNPNAITVNATGGNIVSEDEDDLVRWNIGNTAGLYGIPWTNASNVKIPLVVNITAPGAGGGHFLLSTHTDFDAVNNWDNFDYRPSDVTNMGGPGIANNSANVIDRFWRIEQSGYSVSPQATLNFGYDDAERTNPGNTIPPGSLFAQQFDAGQGWQGEWRVPGSGTDNFPITVVSGADATGPFFKSWTLSVITVPLPVTGLDFRAEKAGDKVRIDWEMESMEGLEAFVLERSSDDLLFRDLSRDPALPGTLNYSHLDGNPLPGSNHYRLRIIDRNGMVNYSEVRTVYFGGSHVLVYPNPLKNKTLQVELQGMEGEELRLFLVDVAGRRLELGKFAVESSRQILRVELENELAAGLYLLEINGKRGEMLGREKVFLP